MFDATDATENLCASAAGRWILVAGSPKLDTDLGAGHHAATETLPNGVLIASTRTVARREVLSTGPKCRTLQPGMLVLLNLDIDPLGALDDGAQFFHESHALLVLEYDEALTA